MVSGRPRELTYVNILHCSEFVTVFPRFLLIPLPSPHRRTRSGESRARSLSTPPTARPARAQAPSFARVEQLESTGETRAASHTQ
eukprot:5886245-Pleurochrysis_carterae.AAC.2